MPIYSYACKDCDHRFDIQQAFSDDALTRCPVCDGALRKVFSAVGVVFKGSGFYRTDSRSSSTGARSGSGSGSGSSGSEGGGGGKDAGAAAPSSTSSTGSSTGAGESAKSA